VVKAIWQKGHIAATHGRFNRIHQVAPMGTSCNIWLSLWLDHWCGIRCQTT